MKTIINPCPKTQGQCMSKSSTNPGARRRAKSKTPPEVMEPEQGELFLCEIVNWSVKDDLASMEYPLFSLSKTKDVTVREYRRGNRVVRIIPSGAGAAMMFDKDLLIYAGSQIVEARNQGLPVSRTVQINSIDFLLGTNRGDGGGSFERIISMLRRLRGTTIETNIPTGKEKITQTDGFSMIDGFRVHSGSSRQVLTTNEKTGKIEEADVEKVYSFSITLSEWLYNALLNVEVLTLDRGYFELGRPLDRRLYELARKHVGDQPMWKCNIDLLAEKVGTTRPRSKFRDELRTAIENDELPQYRVALDPGASPDDVVFYTRDSAKLAKGLQVTNNHTWFQTLERSDNVAVWRARLAERSKKWKASRKVEPSNADE